MPKPYTKQDYVNTAAAIARGEKVSSGAKAAVNRAAKQAGKLGDDVRRALKGK